jgi:predicted nucleotidyltransferase
VAGTFNPRTSDFDFLVEFLPLPEGKRADAYFGLREDLEALFERPIDLVMTQAIRNRYFLAGIRGSRTPLYAA